MALRDWLTDSETTATATVAVSATEISENRHPERDLSDLPTACPLIGGPVPNECRFEPKFFKRMIRGGVLAVGEPCPLLAVCKLRIRKT